MTTTYDFNEEQSGTFTAVLQDDVGNPIGSGDLISLILTITDQNTRTVINNRFKQDVINANGVTIDALGNLTWTIESDDNFIVIPQSPPGTIERHEVLFEWTWGTSKYSNELYYFDVTQTSEIGDVGSDVYGTVLEGNAYFEERLNSDAWDNASNDDKYAALVEAARAIDNLNFAGDKTDEDQYLEFPRNDETIVPNNIKYASFEIAYKLLDGFDPDYEMELLRSESVKYANISESYHPKVLPEWVTAGIISARAWRLLKPYLRDPKILKMSRES